MSVYSVKPLSTPCSKQVLMAHNLDQYLICPLAKWEIVYLATRGTHPTVDAERCCLPCQKETPNSPITAATMLRNYKKSEYIYKGEFMPQHSHSSSPFHTPQRRHVLGRALGPWRNPDPNRHHRRPCPLQDQYHPCWHHGFDRCRPRQ